MIDMSQSSRKIEEVVNVIDGIAFQTNSGHSKCTDFADAESHVPRSAGGIVTFAGPRCRWQ